MTTKKKTAPVKPEAKTNKAETSETKRNVNSEALKKAIDEREQPRVSNQFYVDTVRGVTWAISKDTGKVCRLVFEKDVYADHDLANEPNEKASLCYNARAELETQHHDIVWHDYLAVDRAFEGIERTLDDLRHDIEYGTPCKQCAINTLKRMVDSMSTIRQFRDMRLDLEHDVENVPDVLPDNLWGNYDIVDHHLVKKTPTLKEIHTISGNNIESLTENLQKILPPEVMDQVKNLIPGLTAEKKQISCKSAPKK